MLSLTAWLHSRNAMHIDTHTHTCAALRMKANVSCCRMQKHADVMSQASAHVCVHVCTSFPGIVFRPGRSCCCRCHCSCHRRRRYLFPCCSHCCCFVLFLRYELLVVPLRTQISTHIHTHTLSEAAGLRVCVINSFAASNALWQHERHSTACVYYTPMQVCVCTSMCLYVYWHAGSHSSRSAPRIHTHTHTLAALYLYTNICI